MLFPVYRRLPEGTPCKIEVFLDNRDIKIEVHGKISRVTGDGMAVEFTGVPLDDLEHLRNLIRFNADDPNVVQEEFDAHVGLKPKARRVERLRLGSPSTASTAHL